MFDVWAMWRVPPNKAYTTHYGFCGEWRRQDRMLLVEYTDDYAFYTRSNRKWALQSGLIDGNHEQLLDWVETGTLPDGAWELDES